MKFINSSGCSALNKNQMRCKQMSFSDDEEMRFQTSCKGGSGQCQRTQFSWVCAFHFGFGSCTVAFLPHNNTSTGM